MINLDTIPKLGKDGLDATMKSVGALSKGTQSAAAELADFAKRSFEHGSATMEKLVGVRTLDRAVEIQAEFARSSYESFFAQASKMGELCTTTVKEAYAPMERLVSKQPQAV